MGRSRRQRLDADGDWSERYKDRRSTRRLRDIDDGDDGPSWWDRVIEAKEKNDQDEIERLEAERDRP